MKLLEMFDSPGVKIHSVGWVADSTLQKERLVNAETPIEIILNETQRER